MEEFLKSMDFMRLGQAINHENWQSAMMIIRRMAEKAAEAELQDISKKLSQIKTCVLSRNKSQALNAMAMLTAIRVQRLNNILREKEKTDSEETETNGSGQIRDNPGQSVTIPDNP